MDCKEERKLFKLRMEAEKKFKAILPLSALEPLNDTEIPQGYTFNKKDRAEIRRAEENLNIAKKNYQNHVKNCLICNARNI